MVEIPYVDEHLSMFIILPQSKTGLPELESKLTPELLTVSGVSRFEFLHDWSSSSRQRNEVTLEFVRPRECKGRSVGIMYVFIVALVVCLPRAASPQPQIPLTLGSPILNPVEAPHPLP